MRTAAPVGPWWRACATAGQRIARRPGCGREVSIPVERLPRAGPGGLASAARYSHRPGADGPRVPKPFRSDATTARCAATGLPPSGARSHPGGRPAFFRWPRPKTRTRLSVAPRPGGAPQGATESREARRNQLSSDSGSPARAYLASIAASRASAARALASACWYSSLASSGHSNSRCRRSHYFGRNPEFLVRLACRRNDWRSVRFRKLLWNSGFSVDFDRKRAFSRIESAQKQL